MNNDGTEDQNLSVCGSNNNEEEHLALRSDENVEINIIQPNSSEVEVYGDVIEPEKQKLSFLVSWSVLLVLFAGVFQYGYSIGSLNATRIPIGQAIQEYSLARSNTTMSADELNLIQVIISAAFPVGGIIGCFLVNPLSDKFGIMQAMFYLHAATVIASIFLGLSDILQSYEVIIIGRIIVGIVSSTAGTSMAAIYNIEVSPIQYRGRFGGFLSGFINVGLLAGNVFGLPQVLGNSTSWPVCLAIVGIPSFMFLLLRYFMPDSPRNLYLLKNDPVGAEALLKKLRNSDDVSWELEGLRREKVLSQSFKRMSVKEVLMDKSLRRQIIAAVVIAAAQQLTGLNGVVTYLNNLFILSGISPAFVPYASIIVVSCLATMCIFSTMLMDKLGRRPLLICGFLVEAIFLLLLTITVETQHRQSWISYISLVGATGFLIGFSLGPGPVTLVYIVEFFTQTSRTAALSLSTTTLWVGFTVVVIIWPYMQAAMAGYAFLPFAAIALLVAAYVIIAVPETKGKEVELDEDDLARNITR